MAEASCWLLLLSHKGHTVWLMRVLSFIWGAGSTGIKPVEGCWGF